MNEAERKALSTLRFNWAFTPDDVWGRSPFHIEGMHVDVERAVLASVGDARASEGPSPIGLVIQGAHGVGKTHLLGWVRQQVQHDGGYFFLVGLTDGAAFWDNIVQHVLSGLLRAGQGGDGGEDQLTTLLRRLSSLAGVPDLVVDLRTGRGARWVAAVNKFSEGLQRVDRHVGQKCRDTARALALYASEDSRKTMIGEAYLNSFEETKPGERSRCGIRQQPRKPREILEHISWLLALTGPTVIAVDQIDTLIAQSVKRTGQSDDGRFSDRADLMIAQIADGLMGLRETTRRTLSLLACLPHIWIQIKSKAVDTFGARFTEERPLELIPNAQVGRDLVERRLSLTYREIGFVPPHPTWPVGRLAFRGVETYTPRGLLRRVHDHVQWCLRNGEVRELDRLDAEPEPITAVAPAAPEAPGDLAELDARYAELKRQAAVRAALDPDTEDAVMPGLLSAGLTAWIAELGDEGKVWELDPPPNAKLALLHARLRRTVDEATEDQEWWSFRAIAHQNARAQQARLDRARREAGHYQGPGRDLTLLRNSQWSPGSVTQEHVAAFREAGGRDLPITDDDLRTFSALKALFDERADGMEGWLAARRPAHNSELLGAVLGDLPAGDDQTSNLRMADVSGIELGEVMDSGPPVNIPLATLRMHTAIFAGAGSGKTVLLRRLVEECALLGVSSIVLDPNNDLARLGDPWPKPPRQWGPRDADKSAAYLANTDVVVWTPGRQSGRPLVFQPLPDFSSTLDDVDDFNAAVASAMATLAPRARVTGSTAKADLGLAVLRQALVHYARRGKRSLDGFIELLSNLPEGVSGLANAPKIAAELAQTLTAAKVNDPLFEGRGEPADPGRLLTPATGKKARISVISFVGLPTEAERQGFVNLLQMELFAWVKNNPAADRPLGALFVMDEAQTLAPSGPLVASTHSTITLASQARKFGLGLVFATQAPKALHNRIPGNATTQFIGRLQAGAQIEAVKELARAKNSELPDIGALDAGQFYATSEKFPFRKLQTSLCLSYHPATPLRLEEVVERARNTRQ